MRITEHRAKATFIKVASGKTKVSGVIVLADTFVSSKKTPDTFVSFEATHPAKLERSDDSEPTDGAPSDEEAKPPRSDDEDGDDAGGAVPAVPR